MKSQAGIPEAIDRLFNKAIVKTGTLRNYVQWLEIELTDPNPPNHPYWIKRLQEEWRQCKGIVNFLERRDKEDLTLSPDGLMSDNEIMWRAWRDGDKLIDHEKPYIHPAYRKFNEAYKKKKAEGLIK